MDTRASRKKDAHPREAQEKKTRGEAASKPGAITDVVEHVSDRKKTCQLAFAHAEGRVAAG